jgi:hypothetical protein
MAAMNHGHPEIAQLILAAGEARALNAVLPSVRDDPMNSPDRRPFGARERESLALARSKRPRL